MKFGIISDLHMEFMPWFHTPEEGVFYLNAGDTHPDWKVRDYFHSTFKGNVYSITGNHDYYGGSFADAESGMVDIKYVGPGPYLTIVGATLWTEIHPDRWYDFRSYMMDARQIRGMSYDRYAKIHSQHRKYLFESGADIWVIHHLPSFQSVHDEYKSSGGNDFFASELAPQILEMKKPPKLIVHGHTHKEMDYMIGSTRVVCHPRGYPGENGWENYITYQPKIIELEV